MYQSQYESPFGEMEEMELAAEFLGVGNETELDQFLGAMINRGARATGNFIRSPAGRVLRDILGSAARQALPALGLAVGSYFGGPVGGANGSQFGASAGQLFGLEMEGLDQEEQQLEMARRFVRFGGAAARQVSRSSPGLAPRNIARGAAIGAAIRHAPGFLRRRRRFPIDLRRSYLLGLGDYFPGYAPDVPLNTGSWIRRGPGIVVVNCYGTRSTTEPAAIEPSGMEPALPANGNAGIDQPT